VRVVFGIPFTIAGVLFLSGSFVPELRADLIAYDPFLSGSNRAAGEYTAGTDMRTMGAAAIGWAGTGGIDGFGLSHAGTTANFQANAIGENSAAVSYEAGGRMQWLAVGNTPADRNLTRQLNPTVSGSEWWFSIHTNRLAWANSATNTFVVGGFANATGNGLQVGYDASGAADATNPNLVLRSGGTNTFLATTVANDNQYVLIRLDVNTAGNDTISVWVDPNSVENLGAANVIINNQNVSDSLVPFTQSRYQSPGQSGAVFFDEIRLATTFGSITAIPEPSSIAFVSIAIAFGFLYRRRLVRVREGHSICSGG
jgi:hypothetical protein